MVGNNRTSVVVVFPDFRAFAFAVDDGAGDVGEALTWLVEIGAAAGATVCGAGFTTLATSSVGTTCADQVAGMVVGVAEVVALAVDVVAAGGTWLAV